MSWNRPTLPQLINRVLTDIQIRLEGTNAFLRWCAERVIGTAVAGAAHLLYGNLAWIVQQVIPNANSDSLYIQRWASFFGLTLKTASIATGTISAVGTSGSDLPEGTLYQDSGGNQFSTTADATMTGSSVTVPVTATVAGPNGNEDEGTVLTLVSPVTGVQSTATVNSDGGISGGEPIETAAELLGRLEERVQTPPQNGGPGDYETWALSVAGVTRAWEFPRLLGPGTVSCYFVCDGQAPESILPGDETIDDVQNVFDENAPVTAVAYALSPSAANINPTIHLVPSNDATQQAVTDALNELLLGADIEPGCTVLLSQLELAVGNAPGVTDFTISSPSSNFVAGTGALPMLGTITWD